MHMQKNNKKKIFVALSGGVDSAVSAHILQKDGWDVTGVFIRAWQPDFLPCNQDEEERAAMRVAANLGIAFKSLDLSDEYKKEVVDVMVSEYKHGRTPNPDVLCNSAIKFGAFLQYARENGVDKIATGHHAQVVEKNNGFSLIRGADKNKDQVYFLWKIRSKILQHILMPIGSLQKNEVRAYAEKNNLPSAYKPDSQGLCFIGHVDMKTFLQNFITTRQGTVLNEKAEVVGTHEGSELVTLGQRGGFQLTNHDAQREVHYVVEKNIAENTITVSTEQNTTPSAADSISLSDTNWLHYPVAGTSYQCEIRYHGKPPECTVDIQESKAIVRLTEKILVAPGQSVVIYDREVCIGGGIAQ